VTFSSRADYDRVIKLLLATLLDPDEPPLVTVDRDDVTVAWTARELAAADAYRLDVTVYHGPLGHSELELRLVVDTGWEPNDYDAEEP
jgi:hypothetical protein